MKNGDGNPVFQGDLADIVDANQLEKLNFSISINGEKPFDSRCLIILRLKTYPTPVRHETIERY